MAKKYRVGIIGHTGRGGYGHGLDRVWKVIPGASIVGVADPNEKARAAKVKSLGAAKGFSDYRKMLDETKPQIVSICQRHLDQHRDMVLECARRGIHMYMEKPMCRDLTEADQMVKACEQHKVKLAIAYQTRYSPKIQVVRDIVFSGKIGKVLEVRGRGKEDRRGGGEDLWVLGSHIMNLVHVFAGEANWCYSNVSEGGKPVTKKHVKNGNEGIGPLAGDSLTAVYGHDEGVTSYFASTRGMAGNPRRFGLQILGSKGMIDIVTGYLPKVNYLPDPSWSPGRSGKKWIPVSSAGIGKPEPLGKLAYGAGNTAAVKDLIGAIEEDRQPEASIYEARTSTEMIIAVFESHRLGRAVDMPLKNRKHPLTMLS